ncbi:MAG: imidazole glycerol phosphate synthase subunit HisH [Pseudomonadota bacterium]
MLTIINYGVGNLGSISNMLSYLGVPHQISGHPHDIATAERLLLPGVGAFDYGMQKLKDSGLIAVLNKRVLDDKVPILGICLGMQIMCRKSEEGELPGLAWFEADVKRFDLSKMEQALPVPHMGWNEAIKCRDHPVLLDLPIPARFYFVHSYHINCFNSENILMESRYGYKFTSAIARDNLVAVQFHPEKSHKFGLTILKKFSEWSYVPA